MFELKLMASPRPFSGADYLGMLGYLFDGRTMQDATTGQMVRTVGTLISHLSKSVTLLPGTLISTGSPGGAGYSRDPQVFLRDRSTVTVGIDGIGSLTTHCRILD